MARDDSDQDDADQGDADHDDGLTLEGAVAELYGVPLEDFVTTRTRLAAAAKDAGGAELARELKALRKPSAAAWLLNQVARRDPAAVELVQHVGHRMREATSAGDTAALRSLRPDRDTAISGMVAAAAGVAADEGRAFGAAAADEVRSTVVAALASSGSTAALASGALLRSLSYAGFGEVELDDAVAARLDRPAVAARDLGQARRDRAARAAGEHADGDERAAGDGADATGHGPDAASLADEATARHDEAERALAAARLQAEEADEAHAATRRRTKDLRALLAAAREEEQAAHDASVAATAEVDRAEAALDEARDALR